MSAISTDTPYTNLTPELILQALEQIGLEPTGSLLALNSYENRVYQVGLEENAFVVVKFYRPGRWSDAAILEEHGFAHELAEQEIPVITPLAFDGQTLLEFGGYRYAVYPRRGGRWPELDNKENLQILGRLLGRIHRVGRSSRFEQREQPATKQLVAQRTQTQFRCRGGTAARCDRDPVRRRRRHHPAPARRLSSRQYFMDPHRPTLRGSG